MKLVFDIASSMEFWRQRYPLDRTPTAPRPISLDVYANRCATKKRDIAKLLPDWADSPFLAPMGGVFHALSFDRSQCRQLKSMAVHSWSGNVPEGSFYELDGGILIESPAFMFLHAATVLDFTSLIAFGDELCGLYSFDVREKRGFRRRKQPLIAREALANYLARAGGCQGKNLATRALPYVVDSSASPMETFDEMTMCLPRMRGGYGLPQPAMNHEVSLTERAARVARRRKCYLDMGYPGAMLDVEHHGKLDHTSDEEKARDFERVGGLREMGYEVIELTWAQISDPVAYEIIIERIARIVGKRLTKQVLGANAERTQLRKTILNWNASSGQLRPGRR